MSGMTDFEAGQLVGLVTELTNKVSELTTTMDKIEKRMGRQELQLAKGKGMAAGAVILAAALGGVSSYLVGHMK